MKNAKELMLEYTAFSVRHPKKAAEMFALSRTESVLPTPIQSLPKWSSSRTVTRLPGNPCSARMDETVPSRISFRASWLPTQPYHPPSQPPSRHNQNSNLLDLKR